MQTKCIQCGKELNYEEDEFWWNDQGFGYSTKLCRCSECNQVNIVKYQEDYSLDVNNDGRFYRRK